jgi:hypothetical protein
MPHGLTPTPYGTRQNQQRDSQSLILAQIVTLRIGKIGGLRPIPRSFLSRI